MWMSSEIYWHLLFFLFIKSIQRFAFSCFLNCLSKVHRTFLSSINANSYSRTVCSCFMYLLMINSNAHEIRNESFMFNIFICIGICQLWKTFSMAWVPSAMACALKLCLYYQYQKRWFGYVFILARFHRSIHLFTPGRMCDTTLQYWSGLKTVQRCVRLAPLFHCKFAIYLYQHEFEIRQITNRKNLLIDGRRSLSQWMQIFWTFALGSCKCDYHSYHMHMLPLIDSNDASLDSAHQRWSETKPKLMYMTLGLTSATYTNIFDKLTGKSMWNIRLFEPLMSGLAQSIYWIPF